jgi:ketosteroid isomerase-like protein
MGAKVYRYTLLPFITLLVSFMSFASSISELETEVKSVEADFAETMANRDFERFKMFLAADTIFFDGENQLRGSAAVAEVWKAYFTGAVAPFSWAPETAAVLDDGTLALSSGPVFDSQGKQIAVFNSTWRRQADGAWKIVFDRGGQYCP